MNTDTSGLLDFILRNTPDKAAYQRDIARVAFLYAQSMMGKVVRKREEAWEWREKSLKIYNELRPGHARTIEELTEEDVEGLVVYDFL